MLKMMEGTAVLASWLLWLQRQLADMTEATIVMKVTMLSLVRAKHVHNCICTHQRCTARDGASRGKKERHSAITNIYIPLAMLVIGPWPHNALHVLRA